MKNMNIIMFTELILIISSIAVSQGKNLEQYFTIPEGSPARLECYSSKPNVVWQKEYDSQRPDVLSRNGVRSAPNFDRFIFERELIEGGSYGQWGNGPPGNAKYKYVMKLKTVFLEDSGLYSCDKTYMYYVSIVTEPSCQPIIALMHGPLVEGEETKFECVAEVSSASRVDPRMRFGGAVLADSISLGTKSSNVYLSWMIGDKTLKSSQGDDISDNVEGVTAKKLSLTLNYVADGDDHAKPLRCVLHSDAWKKNKAWETGEGADVKTPTCRVGILNISFGPKLNCSESQVFLEGSPSYDVSCDIRANPLPKPSMITWRSRAEGFSPLSLLPGRITHKRDFSMKAVADVRPFMQAAGLRSHAFSLTVNVTSLRLSTEKVVLARVKKSVELKCTSRKQLTSPLSVLVFCVVHGGSKITADHVRWKLQDGMEIDEDKIQFSPTIPNGVGAILNETQAKQNIYLILTGVGPVRQHQQEFEIDVEEVKEGLFASWEGLLAELVDFVITHIWVLTIIGSALCFILLICCICASLFHAGLLEPTVIIDPYEKYPYYDDQGWPAGV